MNKDLFYDAVRDCRTQQEKADFITLVASVEGARVPRVAIDDVMDFYKKNDQYRRAESLSDFTGVVDEEVETWKKERKQIELEYSRLMREDPREHLYKNNIGLACIDRKPDKGLKECVPTEDAGAA